MSGAAVRTRRTRGAALAALCAGLAVAGLAVAGFAVAGFAGARVARAAAADHAADAAPIAAELVRKYGLPEADADGLRTEVATYLDRGDGAGGVRDLAEAAAASGCRAGCLGAALAAVNRAVWLGHPPDEARKLVLRALRDAARAGGPGTLAERMQARMERFHRRSAGF